jgi:hypothetical protein
VAFVDEGSERGANLAKFVVKKDDNENEEINPLQASLKKME